MRLCLFTINFILIYWSFYEQQLISIPIVLHFQVYGLLVQIPLFFTRVCIFVYCFFVIWPIIYLCTLFNRLCFMILFLIHHINCYFLVINIIDVDLLIGSILFHTWHNLLRSLHCLRYLNFFQSCLMSLLEIIQNSIASFWPLSIYAPFHIRGFLS